MAVNLQSLYSMYAISHPTSGDVIQIIKWRADRMIGISNKSSPATHDGSVLRRRSEWARKEEWCCIMHVALCIPSSNGRNLSQFVPLTTARLCRRAFICKSRGFWSWTRGHTAFFSTGPHSESTCFQLEGNELEPLHWIKWSLLSSLILRIWFLPIESCSLSIEPFDSLDLFP